MPALASSHAPACLGSGTGSAARPHQARVQRALQAQRWAAGAPAARQAAAAVRRQRLCRATAEKEGTQQQQQDGQPQVPNTPPAPTGAAWQQTQQPAEASASRAAVQSDTMSVEEIQRRAALLRQQKEAAAQGGKQGGGLVEGVMEEVGLIKWPSPGKAALNTLLVIGIVAGTAGLLLGINTLLTEASKAVY